MARGFLDFLEGVALTKYIFSRSANRAPRREPNGLQVIFGIIVWIFILRSCSAMFSEHPSSQAPDRSQITAVSSPPEVAASQDLAQPAKLEHFGIWSASSEASSGSPVCRISGDSDGSRLTITADARNPFVIELSLEGRSLKLPSGMRVGVSTHFAGAVPQHLTGYSDGSVLKFDLTRAPLAPWLHEFTAGISLTIEFDDQSLAPRSFDLRGTTRAVNAMADCTQLYGFQTLPPPFLPSVVAPQPAK